MLKVDVIIPAYLPNESYVKILQRALDSLSSQSFKNFKTIVVMNGCFKGGQEIINALSFNNEIEFLEIEQKASAALARNIGISRSSSPLIAFLDADDQFHPDKLQKQVSYFQSNNVDFLGTLAFDFHASDNIQESCFRPGQFQSHEQIMMGLQTQNVMCQSSVMCKRESITKLGGYKLHRKPGDFWPEYGTLMWEDWDLWNRACKAGMSLYNLPDRLCYWSVGTSVER